MKALASSALGLCLIAGISDQADAVIFLETADPLHNTTTAGDNSGWQYEGKFIYFLGVPIGPYHFITAKHFGGNVNGGQPFDFHGEIYTTLAGPDDIPGTDLRIWEVDHAFPSYAPLCSGPGDIEFGKTATVMGRGTLRDAAPWIVGGEPKGFKWGASSDVQRWGRNVIEGVASGGALYGPLLYCDFNDPGITGECHLSTGDSGGGVFVLIDGLWRLAGINLGVDGPFRIPADSPTPAGPATSAAISDKGGLDTEVAPGVWAFTADAEVDVPSKFYSTRISPYVTAIHLVTGGDGSLAPESFSAWQKLYFTPAQIAAPATTGPLADFDADGIVNLLEFALNLEPGFNAQTVMTPVTGLCGLPFVKLEDISGADHVTIEFVRRTSGSGSGLNYMPQFASDLDDWQTAGTETVVSINPRWERVKVVDPETTTSEVKRFARVKVSKL